MAMIAVVVLALVIIYGIHLKSLIAPDPIMSLLDRLTLASVLTVVELALSIVMLLVAAGSFYPPVPHGSNWRSVLLTTGLFALVGVIWSAVWVSKLRRYLY